MCAYSRIRGQRSAAACHEVHRPLPLLIGELAECPGLADLFAHFILLKAAAHGNGDQMLHEHIERQLPRLATSIARWATASRAAPNSSNSSACVGTPMTRLRRAGLVSAATGTLHQASHAFGAADLQHTIDG